MIHAVAMRKKPLIPGDDMTTGGLFEGIDEDIRPLSSFIGEEFITPDRETFENTPKKGSQESSNSRLDAEIRSSAQKFFDLRPESRGSASPYLLPNLSFDEMVVGRGTPLSMSRSVRVVRSLDSSQAELTAEQEKEVVQSFSREGVFKFPHYTFNNIPESRRAMGNMILNMTKIPFNPKSPEKFTVLTWISPSIKKQFIEEKESEHKTIFYVERTNEHEFVIVSIDSIEAPTTRRFMQVLREDISTSIPQIRLHGWTSSPVRQKSLYGCGAFSLDDLSRCHETPDLLEEIRVLPKVFYSEFDAQITLPPQFMVSTQSFTTLIEYLRVVKDVYPQTHVKVANLYATVQANVRLVDGREVNAYIEERNEEFHSKLLKA